MCIVFVPRHFSTLACDRKNKLDCFSAGQPVIMGLYIEQMEKGQFVLWQFDEDLQSRSVGLACNTNLVTV